MSIAVGDYVLAVRTADGERAALPCRPPGTSGLQLDLGLGYQYAIFPTPYGLTTGYAGLAPTFKTQAHEKDRVDSLYPRSFLGDERIPIFSEKAERITRELSRT